MGLDGEFLNFSNAQILKKRCNFTLIWPLDLGNISLEQNLRLKIWIICSLSLLLFICCSAAPWLTVGYYWGNSLTHLMLLTLHLGYQFLVQRWLGEVGSLLLIECPVGFDCNDITLLPTHPKLQKTLSQDLHPLFTKYVNTPNTQNSYRLTLWWSFGLHNTSLNAKSSVQSFSFCWSIESMSYDSYFNSFLQLG